MGHYFTNDEVNSEIRKISTDILGEKFTFFSDNGVFSKDKLDFGTRTFLENIDVANISGDVLDVGCGYGPIGITVAKLTPSNVVMCDVNKRALHLAIMNTKENKVNVTIKESDCYSGLDKEKKYDYILTNPPIRAGKKKVYEIIFGAEQFLKKDGTLFIVVRKDQGAKSMINDLSEKYNVSIVAKNKGFFIIKCVFC